jgi:hypothetical protein
MFQYVADSDSTDVANYFTEDQDEVPEITESRDNDDHDSRVSSGIQLTSKNDKLVYSTLLPVFRQFQTSLHTRKL